MEEVAGSWQQQQQQLGGPVSLSFKKGTAVSCFIVIVVSDGGVCTDIKYFFSSTVLQGFCFSFVLILTGGQFHAAAATAADDYTLP